MAAVMLMHAIMRTDLARREFICACGTAGVVGQHTVHVAQALAAAGFGEIGAANETISRLNRRVQTAESAVNELATGTGRGKARPVAAEMWARCQSVHEQGCDRAARAEAALASAKAEAEDERAARKVAGDSADRFRDVLSECLGHEDENPGDDVLVRELRAHFGRTGPEPTRWRDFCTGALAVVDQINAERQGPTR